MTNSYYDLLNKFYDLLESNHVSSNAQLLYYTLLQINNRSGWTEWFYRTNISICGLIRISEKALTNAKNELKQLGLIEYVSSKKRGDCTKYSILNPTKDGTKEVQKKYKGSTKEVQRVGIKKDIDKEKERDYVSMNEDTPEVSSEKKVVSILPPYEKIIELYNNICISLNPVKQLTEKRKKSIGARYRESKYDLKVFEQVFKMAQSSDFLKGGGTKGWCADFDWLIKPTNWTKVLEGKYANRVNGIQSNSEQDEALRKALEEADKAAEAERRKYLGE